MNGSLLRSGKSGRSNRSSFRPTLESLESREAPAVTTTTAAVTAITSVATPAAAYTDLPIAVNAVRTDLASRNLSTFATDLARVQNDVTLLSTNVASFTAQDRLSIDIALYTNGLSLYSSGVSALASNPVAGVDTALLGYQAALDGVLDAQLTALSSTGTQTLSSTL